MKTSAKRSATTSANRPGAERLQTLCEERGVSLSALSALIDKNPTYLQQYVKLGVPKEICLDGRIKLSRFFHVQIGELTNDPSDTKMLVGATRLLDKKKIAASDSTVSLPILPVRGSKIDFRGKGIASMNTPSFLLGVDGAYSTTMPDNTMEPAIRKGAMIFVNPSRLPTTGNEIVVQMKDKTGFVAVLVARTEQNLIVKTINPSREIVLDRDRVESIHYIVAAMRDASI